MGGKGIMAQISSGSLTIVDVADSVSGINTVTLYLYQRAASAPARPSTDLTYNFATTELTGVLGNWTRNMGELTGSQPIWITAAVASSNGSTDIIEPGEWTAPIKMAEDGKAGFNQATVYIYQRSVGQPNTPSDTTYTFASGAFTTPSGWSTSIPQSNGKPCWVSSAVAIGNGATALLNWVTPAILAEDGKDGKSPTVTPTSTGVIIHDPVNNVDYAITNGQDGTSYYTHVRYSKNSNGSGYVTQPTSETKYIGVYSGPSKTAPAYNASGWTWSLYVGTDAPNITGTRELYWLKTNTSNPVQITWNSSTSQPSRTIYSTDRVNDWTSVVPTYIVNGTYYTCIETSLSNSTKIWSAPTENKALTTSCYDAAVAKSIAQGVSADAIGALSIARGVRQHFFNFSTDINANIPAGSYIAEEAEDTFKAGPNKGNLLTRSDGIWIRNGAHTLAALQGGGLSFFVPNGNLQGKLGMKLDASSLTFYNIDTSNSKAATLSGTGLILAHGGIEAGTKNSANYIYIYSNDDTNHNLTINGHTASDWRIIAGNKFGVDKGGNLYASNATVSGKITVGAGSNVYTTDNVNPLHLGGENLLQQFLIVNVPTTYNCYRIPLAENLIAGETYTLQLWGVKFTNTPAGGTVAAYWGGGSNSLTGSLTPNSSGYVVKTFTVTQAMADRNPDGKHWYINLYNSVPSDSKTARNMTLERWKLEKGNKATDWSISSADTKGGVNLLRDTADMKVGGGAWATGTFRASGGTVSHVSAANPHPNGIIGAIRVINGGSSATRIGFAQDGLTTIQTNKLYTLSGWVRASVSGLTVDFQPIWASSTQTTGTKQVGMTDTSWTYFSATLRLTGTQNASYSAGYVYVNAVPANGWFEVCGLKLEEGAIATGWVPGQEAIASDYITQIDNNGIWVTPAGKRPTNASTGAGATGTKIDGNGVGIYVGGAKLAQYGTTTYFYEPDGTIAASLDGTGLNIKTGTITLGSFKVTAAGDLTATSATFGGTNGITITSSKVTLGSNCSISWNNVSGKDNVANKSDIPTTAQITQISNNAISTATIKATQINANTLSAITANMGTLTAGIITTNSKRTTYNAITSGLTLTMSGIGAGNGSTNTFYVNTSGTLYASAATIIGKITANTFTARDYVNSTYRTRAIVDGNGLTIYDGSGTGSTNIQARFGSTVQIGKTSAAYISLDSSAISIFSDSSKDKIVLGSGAITFTKNSINVGNLSYTYYNKNTNLYGLSLCLNRATTTTRPGFVGLTAKDSSGGNIFRLIYVQDNATIGNYTSGAINIDCTLDMNHHTIKDVAYLANSDGVIKIDSARLMINTTTTYSPTLYVNGTAYITGTVDIGGALKSGAITSSGVIASGGAITSSGVITSGSNIRLKNNTSLQGANTSGSYKALIYISTNNTINLGNSDCATYVNGTSFRGSHAYSTSDLRLKHNISLLDKRSSELIMRLKPFEFEWTEEQKNFQHNGKYFGFGAQEVKQALSEVGYDSDGYNIVKKDPEGYYALGYEEFIPHLVKMAQELKTEIEELKEAIKHLS